MNRLLTVGILALAFSSASHAAGVANDLLVFKTNYPDAGSVSYTSASQVVDQAGTRFHDNPDPSDATLSLTVTQDMITVESTYGHFASTANYYGFSFTNLSRSFPGQYVLWSSTFNEDPSSLVYSTVGNVFAVDLTSASSARGGQLIFKLSSPVPEPESYAMLLAGLGLMGTIAKRRQRQHTAAVASA